MKLNAPILALATFALGCGVDSTFESPEHVAEGDPESAAVVLADTNAVSLLPANFGYDQGLDGESDDRCRGPFYVGNCLVPNSRTIRFRNNTLFASQSYINEIDLQINTIVGYLNNRGWNASRVTSGSADVIVADELGPGAVINLTKQVFDGLDCDDSPEGRVCTYDLCTIVYSPTNIDEQMELSGMNQSERANFMGNVFLNALFHCTGLGSHGSQLLMSAHAQTSWRNGALSPTSEESTILQQFQP